MRLLSLITEFVVNSNQARSFISRAHSQVKAFQQPFNWASVRLVNAMPSHHYDRRRICSNYLDREPRKEHRDHRSERSQSSSSRRVERRHYSSTHSRSERHEADRVKSSRREENRLRSIRSEMREMLKIEHHHIIFQEDSKDDELPKHLDWCPQYLDPNLTGHMRGGRQEMHHRCRQCQRLCLHLLGKPGQRRMCLGCAGYSKEDIPRWYYHDQRCRHCKKR